MIFTSGLSLQGSQSKWPALHCQIRPSISCSSLLSFKNQKLSFFQSGTRKKHHSVTIPMTSSNQHHHDQPADKLGTQSPSREAIDPPDDLRPQTLPRQGQQVLFSVCLWFIRFVKWQTKITTKKSFQSSPPPPLNAGFPPCCLLSYQFLLLPGLMDSQSVTLSHLLVHYSTTETGTLSLKGVVNFDRWTCQVRLGHFWR